MAFDFNKLQPLETGIPGQNVKTPGFNFGNLPEVGAPAPEPVKQPGFIQSVVQDIAKPFLKTAVTPYAIAKGAINLSQGNIAAADEALTKEYDFGYFGKTKALGAEIAPTASAGEVLRKGGKEVLGTALEIGSNLIGGEGTVGVGKSLLKSQLKKALISSGKTGFKIGATGAAGRALQEDQSLGNIAAETAIGGGIGAVTGAGLGIAGVGAKALATPLSTVTQNLIPGLDKIAGKIEKIVLKPREKDYLAGFKEENVLKYDLGGSVRDTIKKATEKLTQLRNQARTIRGASNKVINLSDIVKETADQLKKDVGQNVGLNQDINKALEYWVKELEIRTDTGKLDIPGAQELKEAIGTFGNWQYGTNTPESSAKEVVSNVLYSKIKNSIEKNTPQGLKDINKQMSDIIPIKNAAVKRLPVEERNAIAPISDIIAASAALQNPAGWGLVLLNQLQKSGRFAQKLYQTSTKLRTGAESISDRMKGLRITPESLLNRNNQLRKTALRAIKKK
jgi:hypothetical protein